MLYVDTGCLLKLYYPENNSAAVAAAVAGEELCFTDLHALEVTTALQLKIFRREATTGQAAAAQQTVQEDLLSGKLVNVECDWRAAWQRARELAFRHSAATGCRALDALHCALALTIGPLDFLTTDSRQHQTATASGLVVRNL